MEFIPENRLREMRQKKGLSQAELASKAGVSRQTVGGIENGQYGPSLTVAFQLARALGKSVESIFWLPEQVPEEIFAEFSGIGKEPAEGDRIHLARLTGSEKYTAFPVSHHNLINDANAITKRTSKNKINAKVLNNESFKTPAVVLAGCSPALNLLKQKLYNRFQDVRLYWFNTNSMRSLEALKNGFVHGAGIHILDEETGEYNLPVVKKVLRGKPHLVVNLCYSEQGFVTQKDNPKSIKDFYDLSRNDVKLVNREKGAETRRIMDAGVRNTGMKLEEINNYNFIVKSHMDIAQAVALGAADCGITLRSVAEIYNLDFVPLTRERFDLVFLLDSLKLPAIQAVLEQLSNKDFRFNLESYGFDPSDSGQILFKGKFK